MAIYDAGTASLTADGTVIGVGTTWRQPLTLIRVGATMIFNTTPASIVTIAEILSDTEIRVFNDKGFTAPAGTLYSILAHDGITVQGLAQDVAETLRYYQSRETEVAAAVDAFNQFDANEFQQNVTNVNMQSQQVANDAAQVSLDRVASELSANSALSSSNSAASSASIAESAASSVSGALIGSFQGGVTLNSRTQQILNISNGIAESYIWQGEFPKVVPANSTPESTGGFGDERWLMVGSESKISSIPATKYMSQAEKDALASADLSLDHSSSVQMALDEAHNLKCSVYFPAGTYCFDTAVNVWSYVKAIWSDGSAVITRRYRTYFINGSTSEVDPSRDTRKLMRILNGAVGRTLVHGLEFDGNARSIEVAESGQAANTGIPDQTYYADLEPGGTSPYIHGPDGNTFIQGENYFTHDKKTSGTIVSQCVFRDAPGGCITGNMRNVTVTGSEFHGWYDHAVYAAGSAFEDQGNGILVGDIAVSGNTFRNRINTRGNLAVKGRFGFNRYTVTGNTFDCIDGCMAFDTGHGFVGSIYAQQPWGQISVTGNTANTSGAFMMISNNTGTKWFNSGWLSALTVTGNTVQSTDRIFLLGVSGSNDYVMDGYNVNIENNVFLAPIFMTLYTYVTNSDWLIANNTINITGTNMIIGTDTANNSNSTLRLNNNVIGGLSVASTSNLHLSSFVRVKMRENEIRNCSLSFGSYSTDLTIEDNNFRWASGLPTNRIFGAMFSNTGSGFSNVNLIGNTFSGSPTRFNVKFATNSKLRIERNDFGTINGYFFDISGSGYSPRVMLVRDNILLGGRLVSGIPTGTVLASNNNYMELSGNYVSSPTPGTAAASTLFADDNGQSWVSHYQTIRCVGNTFKDAINGIDVSGSASASANTTNKFWFGNNVTINTTVRCNYPSANKANTDVPQSVSV